MKNPQTLGEPVCIFWYKWPRGKHEWFCLNIDCNEWPSGCFPQWSFSPAHLCGNWKQQLSCSVPVPLDLPRSSWPQVQSIGSFCGALPPCSGMCQCFEAVQWCPCVISVHLCVYWSPLVNCSTGVFAEGGWTLTLVFEDAVSVLCWLGLWDSCLAHLPNGKWHLSWCLLSEGVVSGRWCYWPL